MEEGGAAPTQASTPTASTPTTASTQTSTGYVPPLSQTHDHAGSNDQLRDGVKAEGKIRKKTFPYLEELEFPYGAIPDHEQEQAEETAKRLHELLGPPGSLPEEEIVRRLDEWANANENKNTKMAEAILSPDGLVRAHIPKIPTTFSSSS